MNKIEQVAWALCTADDGGNAEAIFSAKGHNGDCTKENWTCPVCQAEEYTRLALATIHHLAEQGLVLVPREPTKETKLAIADELRGEWIDKNRFAESVGGRFYKAMINVAQGGE